MEYEQKPQSREIIEHRAVNQQSAPRGYQPAEQEKKNKTDPKEVLSLRCGTRVITVGQRERVEKGQSHLMMVSSHDDGTKSLPMWRQTLNREGASKERDSKKEFYSNHKPKTQSATAVELRNREEQERLMSGLGLFSAQRMLGKAVLQELLPELAKPVEWEQLHLLEKEAQHESLSLETARQKRQEAFELRRELEQRAQQARCLEQVLNGRLEGLSKEEQSKESDWEERNQQVWSTEQQDSAENEGEAEENQENEEEENQETDRKQEE